MSEEKEKFLEIVKEEESEEEFFDTENKDIKIKMETKVQETIRIPIFDGQDYSNWKRRITMYLKMKECEVVITRAKTAADKEKWDNQIK